MYDPLLDNRKQFILKAVVTDYVITAEPVGSKALVTRYQLNVKSATIRNEMAELSELGYLRQPHTSAGRIPSDMGYRFYVDRLMETAGLPASEVTRAKDKLTPHRSEIDNILEHTCRILSDLARYTSVATQPNVTDTTISYVSAAAVGYTKLLVIVVLDNGRVIHDLLEMNPRSARIDPVRATNYLMEMLGNRTLTSVCASTMDPITEDAPEMADLLNKVRKSLRRELELANDADIHLQGASYIMQQPEFKDIERLEAILSALEHKSTLYRLLSSAYLGHDVTVIIGSENPVDNMRDCSFVGAKYYIGERAVGTIGVVGPTRMDYRRAVAAVRFMAGNLSELLSDLSVS